MQSIYKIHTFDAYLLHVSVPVHYHQGEQLCQFLEKPTTVMTLLSMVSILQFICKEHKYTVEVTTELFHVDRQMDGWMDRQI
jgi:hypothetical protein